MEQTLKVIETLSQLSERIAPDAQTSQLVEELIRKVEELLQSMHQTHPTEATMLLATLEGDLPLLQSVAQLVRFYHQQLLAIQNGLPEKLNLLAQAEIIDASERLQHILEMTDKAANRTMDLTEEGLNLLTERDRTMTELQDLLEKQAATGPSNSVEILQQLRAQDEQLQELLTNILVAQDYQDLTGQIIQRIVKLMREVDQGLLDLIRRYGRPLPAAEPDTERGLQGPLHEESKDKQSQADVDDLLQQLGF